MSAPRPGPVPARADGRFAGTGPAPLYVVVADVDSRFALAGTRVAANYGLSVLSAERPYRALWATRGLTVDGWTTPGRAATLRVYPQPEPGPETRRVAASLDTPPAPTAMPLPALASAISPKPCSAVDPRPPEGLVPWACTRPVSCT